MVPGPTAQGWRLPKRGFTQGLGQRRKAPTCPPAQGWRPGEEHKEGIGHGTDGVLCFTAQGWFPNKQGYTPGLGQRRKDLNCHPAQGGRHGKGKDTSKSQDYKQDSLHTKHRHSGSHKQGRAPKHNTPPPPNMYRSRISSKPTVPLLHDSGTGHVQYGRGRHERRGKVLDESRIGNTDGTNGGNVETVVPRGRPSGSRSGAERVGGRVKGSSRPPTPTRATSRRSSGAPAGVQRHRDYHPRNQRGNERGRDSLGLGRWRMGPYGQIGTQNGVRVILDQQRTKKGPQGRNGMDKRNRVVGTLYRTSQLQREVPHVRNRRAGEVPGLLPIRNKKDTSRRGRRGGMVNDKHHNAHPDELGERRVKRVRWLGDVEAKDGAGSIKEKATNHGPRHHRGVRGHRAQLRPLRRCMHRNSTRRHFERPQRKMIRGIRGPIIVATAFGGISTQPGWPASGGLPA